MLHMAVLRSPHAHAGHQANIDLGAAKAAPGVRLALSGADLAGKIGSIVPNWIIPGTKVPDRPVVAIDRVRFVGECVALVVAETQAMAHDAIGLIDVDYDTLPAVTDEEAAIRDGAPQLHDNVPNNITTVYKMGGGDYGKAAREADQIITLRIANNRLIPTCMETRSILAEPDVDGTLTLYLQSQVPHMHRRWIADTVGISEHQLRIVAPDIGGGFGAKMHLSQGHGHVTSLAQIAADVLQVPIEDIDVVQGDTRQVQAKGLRSLAEPLQLAMDNGAKRALIPLENKRSFLEVTGDVIEHVDPIFFGDPKTAAFKALGLN